MSAPNVTLMVQLEFAAIEDPQALRKEKSSGSPAESNSVFEPGILMLEILMAVALLFFRVRVCETDVLLGWLTQLRLGGLIDSVGGLAVKLAVTVAGPLNVTEFVPKLAFALGLADQLENVYPLFALAEIETAVLAGS